MVGDKGMLPRGRQKWHKTVKPPVNWRISQLVEPPFCDDVGVVIYMLTANHCLTPLWYYVMDLLLNQKNFS